MVLVCYVILQDLMIKGSYDLMRVTRHGKSHPNSF